MHRVREKFHRTQHNDGHKDNTASASPSTSSGGTSRDSKHLLTQSSGPPPYTEVSKNQPFDLSTEDKSAATRAPGAIDKRPQIDAGVGASSSSSQSDGRGTAYPGPSTARASLQLCPHEDLTFERLQIIKDILYDEYLEMGIDVIGNTAEKQHEEILDPFSEWPLEVTVCHADERTHYTGTFKMKLSSKPHKFFGHKRGPVIGLELHVHWKLEVGIATSDNSRDQVNRFLQKSNNLQLCPHKVMSDPWIQETVYNFRRVRDLPGLSSVDRYMQGTHKSKPPPSQPPAHDCDRCKTHVEVSYDRGLTLDKIHVDIVRHLGEGVVENDPAWLAQCGFGP